MKVSIITAVLNGATEIDGTLDSIAGQDYQDLEHIVVDGGSRDATLEIVRARTGAASRVVLGPDTGVYDAFNKGLRAATGDVIAYLNCGDRYASSSVVSRVMHEMAAHAADAVFADLLIVDPGRRSRVVRRYSSKRFSPGSMSYGLMPAHPTLFLRREVYDAAGEYDPSFRIAGDFEFCLRAFVRRETAFRYIAEPLVRMTNGGVSNRGWRSKWQITREMLRACRMNGIETSRARLCLRFPLKMLEMI
jgi:glycosyltransferase involved in cell wall biosynthesis